MTDSMRDDSMFFDRDQGPMAAFLDAQGLPKNAPDEEIIAALDVHMKETGYPSLLPLEHTRKLGSTAIQE